MIEHLFRCIGRCETLCDGLRISVLMRRLFIDGNGHVRGPERKDDFALVDREPICDLFDGGLGAMFLQILFDVAVDVARRLFERARDFDASVVAQKALDLPCDHGDGIRRKAHAEALVKAGNGL